MKTIEFNETVNKILQAELQNLSKKYKEEYFKMQEHKQKADEIKERMKEIAGDSDYEDNNVKIIHYDQNTVKYSQFVKDNNIEIPDEYRTKSTNVKVIIQKETPEPEKYIV